MAKKKKLESKAPVPLTRGQLSRAQREQRQIRNLYTAGIAIATLVALVIGYAAISTYVLRPNAQVAKVGETTINRATYNKMRRWNVYQNIQTAAFQQQFGGSGTSLSSPDVLQAQLVGVEDEPLDTDTVNQLINDEVLRQKSASDFGVNPDTAKLKEAALKDFIPQPTPPPDPTSDVVASPTVSGTATVAPTSSITPTATATATPGSPTATPTATPTLPPVPGAQQTAETTYSSYIQALDKSTSPQSGDVFCALGCPDLSESDYLSLIIDPRVRRDEVIEKLTATKVMTEVEQINAQHILTATREGALQIKAMLDAGADFTELANTQSSEQLNNIAQGGQPNGGNLGWFPREGSGLVKEFVEGAWPVEKGKYSDPVFTSFGYHIIKVLDRDPKRPREQTQIDTLKNQYYDEWFQEAYKSLEPSIQSNVPKPTAIPTQPPLVEPTPPPPAPAETPAQTPTGPITPTVGTAPGLSTGGDPTGTALTSPTAAGTVTGTLPITDTNTRNTPQASPPAP
jgi:hypothetical protein